MNSEQRSAVFPKPTTSFELVLLVDAPSVICSLITNKWEAEMNTRRSTTYYDRRQSISRKYLPASETGMQFQFASVLKSVFVRSRMQTCRQTGAGQFFMAIRNSAPHFCHLLCLSGASLKARMSRRRDAGTRQLDLDARWGVCLAQ